MLPICHNNFQLSLLPSDQCAGFMAQLLRSVTAHIPPPVLWWERVGEWFREACDVRCDLKMRIQARLQCFLMGGTHFFFIQLWRERSRQITWNFHSRWRMVSGLMIKRRNFENIYLFMLKLNTKSAAPTLPGGPVARQFFASKLKTDDFIKICVITNFKVLEILHQHITTKSPIILFGTKVHGSKEKQGMDFHQISAPILILKISFNFSL